MELTFRDAIREALVEEMERDPAVFLLGEDIGLYGGAFGVTKGLLDRFGSKRVVEPPISENSFVGLAVGAAASGLRPVVEIMFMDFIALAMDPILNQASKLHYIYGGQVNVPLVIRAPSGAGRGYGASHSQSLETLFQPIPGLKIVVPSTPADAKGLLKSAIRDDSPVLFVEPKLLYGVKGEVPAGEHLVPIGKARIARVGTDVSILAIGRAVGWAMEAAEKLEAKGKSAEVVDLRTLKPLDGDAIAASVRKTGRAVVVEESPMSGGVGAEVLARVAETCFSALKGPVARVAVPDVPIPASTSLEASILPDADAVVAACERTFARG
ncbi:MAG: alpha-ketoacid dehydrogenase subunit beta [Planctomycetota bacterium]